MPPKCAIAVEPHDLARRVDPVGYGETGVGGIDRREHASIIEKAMEPRTLEVEPPTIWPRELIPKGSVLEASGTSIGVKVKEAAAWATWRPPQEEAQYHQ